MADTVTRQITFIEWDTVPWDSGPWDGIVITDSYTDIDVSTPTAWTEVDASTTPWT